MSTPAMFSSRRLHSAVAVCLVALALVRGGTVRTESQAAGGDVAVVVNPGVPVDNLTLAELRRLLLGDREFWTAGMRVTLLIRAPVAHERDAAVRDVCQMSEAQFRQHWIGKVFRADAATGPRIVYSAEMAMDQVIKTPGAMTFVAASAARTGGGKIVKIDGKLPGQAGYPLK
jgi:ABC-type phosphate transport system substrate-binding protein